MPSACIVNRLELARLDVYRREVQIEFRPERDRNFRECVQNRCYLFVYLCRRSTVHEFEVERAKFAPKAGAFVAPMAGSRDFFFNVSGGKETDDVRFFGYQRVIGPVSYQPLGIFEHSHLFHRIVQECRRFWKQWYEVSAWFLGRTHWQRCQGRWLRPHTHHGVRT